MNLIIVESPTKARTLSRFLGSDYQIQATMGHVSDLPKNKFGVDIKNNFEPEYEVVSGKQDAIKAIQKASKAADAVYLATDPDREGEAIAWHVSQLLSSKGLEPSAGKVKTNLQKQASKKLFQRIVFHEITETALHHALDNPRDIDIDLVHAQTARRVLDRVVGYKLSPLLWRKVRSGLSAGRVQSVAVRLIVEREKEIEAFKTEEYWEIFCEVKSEKLKVQSFIVKLIEIDGKKAEVKNKEQADRVVSELEKANYQVDSVEKREAVKAPHPPFTTSTMTQTASRLFGWSAKKTMAVAQKLYEEGFITYHRTDSTNLAQEAINNARNFITSQYGNNYLAAKPRIYKTSSKVAQEAHEAIRPSDVYVTSSKEQIAKLVQDMIKLYGLIWKRFVACQMASAVYDETTINVKVLGTSAYLLQAKGQVIKFDGWKKVYGGVEKGEVQLPDIIKDEPLDLIKVDPQQKFTEPSARYTEASLIKTLEKLSIGRPSTYAPIISTIQDRQYVEKNDGKFIPTPIGIATSEFLLQNFPDIIDYQFTARMEDGLDEVANGKSEWVPMLKDFWQPFSKRLEEVSEKAERVKIKLEDTGQTCPECKEGTQVIRIGRFGKFLSCSRFPECKWKGKFIEKINMKCPDCKEGDLVVKKTAKGRKFFGCSRYPECKFASWYKPSAPAQLSS